MEDFTAEQREILDAARRFNAAEAARFIDLMESQNRFPPELPRVLAQYGLMGMRFPREYGGSGLDAMGAALAIEELARVSPAIADVILCLHAGTGLLLAYANAEQKARFLPPVARGERLSAYGLTEREAGSDLAALRTVAQPTSDGFALRGAKIFITLGAVADFAVVLARTNLDAEKPHRGMSLLLVEGHNRGKPQEFMGLRGTAVAGISFNNLVVPRQNIVGVENEGFKQVMKSLDGGRIEVAALSVGLAQGALDEAVKYARQRKQFGRRIADFQGIQFLLADMQTRIDAARGLTYRAACLRDAGRPHSREASQAKLFASEAALQCASDALQIHGGYGYWKKFAVERLFRDAKITQIFEGTNQIQRIVIARSVLEEG